MTRNRSTARPLEPGLAGVAPEPHLRAGGVARHVAGLVAARGEPRQSAGRVERAAEEFGLAGEAGRALAGERRVAQRQERGAGRRPGAAGAAAAPSPPPPTARARWPSAPPRAAPSGSRSASNATRCSGPSGTTTSRVTPGRQRARPPARARRARALARARRRPRRSRAAPRTARPGAPANRPAAGAAGRHARTRDDEQRGRRALAAGDVLEERGPVVGQRGGDLAPPWRPDPGARAGVARASVSRSASACVSRSASVRARRRSASVNAASARPPRASAAITLDAGPCGSYSPSVVAAYAYRRSWPASSVARQRSRSRSASVSSRSARPRSPEAAQACASRLRTV